MNQKLNDTLNYLKKYFSNDLAKNIKENWQLIMVAVIIIAVFVNSWGNDQLSRKNSNQKANQNSKTPQNTPPQNQPENGTDVAQAKEELNAFGENIIKETAAKGEGVTHLARKAVKEYLQNNNETLSAEQKIYAEDYLKRQISSQPLEIGQVIEFKTDLIKTGIARAKALNQKQIENLSKYVPLIRNLN